MADELPESIKLKLLKKMMSSLKTSGEQQEKKEEIDPEKLVWSKLSDEKAVELMRKAKALYPAKYEYAIRVLAYLIQHGELDELDGYTTLVLLNRLGVPVRPDLRIKFVKHGKEVDMKEYLE
ncbi:MAG: hypothetical protein GXO43_09680 [Crenarchaeota archaeon]|nr:hypothetical protein [Thermoproteota archaeon]